MSKDKPNRTYKQAVDLFVNFMNNVISIISDGKYDVSFYDISVEKLHKAYHDSSIETGVLDHSWDMNLNTPMNNKSLMFRHDGKEMTFVIWSETPTNLPNPVLKSVVRYIVPFNTDIPTYPASNNSLGEDIKKEIRYMMEKKSKEAMGGELGGLLDL